VIAMMSGSGSVVFGVFDTDAQAAAAADALESASGGRARIVITRTADRVERVEAG
jgi:4-diphosphocytidyl-2C-methyl-D-erythritol kinase